MLTNIDRVVNLPDIFNLSKMDLVLQSPEVIQSLISSYVPLEHLQSIYSSAGVGLINVESAKFTHLTKDQLTLYNPKLLKEVTIVELDDPMALTELYTFTLKRLSIDNLTEAVKHLDTPSRQELRAVFTHLALTLEELELYDEANFYFDDPPTSLLSGIYFLRLKKLSLRSMYEIDAPELTSLRFDATTVDITDFHHYPNLTEFIAEGCYIKNLWALKDFPLTTLELSEIELEDEEISIIKMKLTTLTLVSVPISDELVFPRTLEHLTIDTHAFDISRIWRLKLNTLHLTVTSPTHLSKIRLSRLESLNLTGFTLDDTFFLDAPILTTLTLAKCTITYTTLIQAKRLSEVVMIDCETSDWVPDSVVDLTMRSIRGLTPLKWVRELTNLRSLQVSKTKFKLKWVRRLKLNRLVVNQCDVSTLKYLREMTTLRELSLANNPEITDVSLHNLTHLHLAIVDLYDTGVQGPGLKYLPSTLHKLTLPSIEHQYLEELNLSQLQELWVAVNTPELADKRLLNQFTGEYVESY